MNTDALAARLLAIFAMELDEQVRAANGYLLALERAPGDEDALRALFRVMHTLKGAARAAGVAPVESACHRLEALLVESRDGRRTLDRSMLDTLFAGVDALGDAGVQLARGESVDPTRLEAIANPDVPLPLSPAVPRTVPKAVPTTGPNAGGMSETAILSAGRDLRPRIAPSAESYQPRSAPSSAPTSEPQSPAPVPEESVRIAATRLDELLSATTRLRITGGQIARRPEALRALHGSLALAARTARELARHLHAAATEDADHAATALATTLDDTLGALVRDAGTLSESADGIARDLVVVTDDITDGVHALRLRPVADAVEALPRLVRDVATATGKQVRLEIVGERVEADRAVLGHLRDAILHLVRNAIDHGIERPDVRQARGKPAEATVRVVAGLLGDRLVVTVSDDGAGIDVAAVRARLADAGERVPADDHDVARRLFLGGISTRLAADAISGRGVGLDAVRAAIQRARGGVDVTWTPGAGTTFTLEMPLTLATIRALLVRVGNDLAALPTAHVERLLLIRPDDMAIADGRPVVLTGGAPAPLASLARVLGPPMRERDRAAGATRPAVLLRVGGRQLALGVDELVDEREVVVRPITGRGRDPLPHVSGAALLPSGEIALVLDATAVVNTGLGAGADAVADLGAAAKTTEARPCRILVVDDSITTRTLEQSVLEAAGYDVITGVDGADGWRVLQERGADLVVSDFEMPRMDGLALCRAIRESKRFRETPVVLITARESPEDRAAGLEAGADAYLGKSSFDQQSLLDTIRELIG